jgi:UDP-N-acetylmuramate--alanine ligase
MTPIKPIKTRQPFIYMIGIGGIGMSALARWFKAHGYKVAGSDLVASSVTKELVSEGIEVITGPHHKENVPEKADRVVFNQAIQGNNPELIHARELGIPTASYPERIGELSKIYKTIAIAGAHGKSTTTAMMSLIGVAAKIDPTVIIGTKLKEFGPPAGGKNFRSGKSEYLILEADEWKASFLNYFPYAVLVTNIDKEHLDFYKNFNDIKKTFLKFIDNVNIYGLVVLNRDNADLYNLRKKISRPIVWYSVKNKEAASIKKILKIPGLHNLSNAVGAYTLSRALGIPKRIILRALAKYTGAWRRLEYRGHFRGAEIFDDYGHHPTEIKATLAGLKEQNPRKRLICVFQPHQRERLKKLFKEFTKAFDAADEMIVLDIYAVAGREEPRTAVNAEKLVKNLSKKFNKRIPLAKTPQELKDILKNKLKIKNGDMVVMMGAGNINEWTDSLISKL